MYLRPDQGLHDFQVEFVSRDRHKGLCFQLGFIARPVPVHLKHRPGLANALGLERFGHRGTGLLAARLGRIMDERATGNGEFKRHGPDLGEHGEMILAAAIPVACGRATAAAGSVHRGRTPFAHERQNAICAICLAPAIRMTSPVD